MWEVALAKGVVFTLSPPSLRTGTEGFHECLHLGNICLTGPPQSEAQCRGWKWGASARVCRMSTTQA